MRRIDRIFVHCTASSQKQTVQSLLTYFRVEKKWRYPGYHYVISPDGTITQLLDEAYPCNGVKGYNATSISIAWIGGISNRRKSIDNRTDAQKDALVELLSRLRVKYPAAKIMGHRDISPDRNHNGVVDPWERVKDCPCFDAMVEYKDL